MISALLVASVACSSPTAATSPLTEDPASPISTAAVAQAGDDGETHADHGENDGLLGIDLSAPAVDNASVTHSIDGVVVDTEDAHEHGGAFLGPPMLPDPPMSGSDPLEYVAWLGTVLLNRPANQPFDSRVFNGFISHPLAVEFEDAFAPSEANQDVAHRAVLVDSWVIGSTATSTRVEAVAVFERTAGIGDIQLPGFEFVYLDVTLVLDPSARWVAVELLVSS